MNEPKRVESVIVLGGGSAGLIAALTLKRKLPQLRVEVIRSPRIGVIGVGEATTAAFPRHFFEYLRMNPADFYTGAEPTWKLGIHFIWGPRPQGFYYTFQNEYKSRWPEMSRNTGFYFNDETQWLGIVSACMAHNIAFPRRPDGSPHIHNAHAFHIENIKLVHYLEDQCRRHHVVVTDGEMKRAERGPEGIAALHLEDGRRAVADLYVDASGFRSALLGETLKEPFISYGDSLFNDRAVTGGWPRGDDEVTRPYTTATTMNCGWSWRIDHEHWINCGYVYSSSFISDEEALNEFLEKHPKVANEPRFVKLRPGRYRRLWVGNVVGIGNSAGFVEPLESTSLQIICVEASTLADSLVDSMQAPPPSMIDLYNTYNTRAWDDIRDFLAVHFRFNTRLNTEYWRACREDSELHGAEVPVRFFRENGPSVLAEPVLFDPNNSFGMEGYLAMLLGQRVPHSKPYTPPPQEATLWRERLANYGAHARRGFTVEQTLAAIRAGNPAWDKSRQQATTTTTFTGRRL